MRTLLFYCLISIISIATHAQEPLVLKNSTNVNTFTKNKLYFKPDTVKNISSYSSIINENISNNLLDSLRKNINQTDSIRKELEKFKELLDLDNKEANSLAAQVEEKNGKKIKIEKSIKNERNKNKINDLQKKLYNIRTEIDAIEINKLQKIIKIKNDSLKILQISRENALNQQESISSIIKLSRKINLLNKSIKEFPSTLNAIDKKINDCFEELDYFKSKTDKYVSFFDTTMTSQRKVEFIDTLSIYSSKASTLQRELNKLFKNIDALYSFTVNADFKYFNKLDSLPLLLSNKESASFIEKFTNFYNNIKENEMNASKIVDEFNSINTKKKEIFKNAENTIKHIAKEKVPQGESEVGALPSLISSIGDLRQLNLSMNLLASFTKQLENLNYVAIEGRLFTTNSNPITRENLKNFFINEYSPFGFQLKGTYGNRYKIVNLDRPQKIDPVLKYGLNLQVNFLTKKFTPFDTLNNQENFTNFFIHTKGGFEVVIVDKVLGMYMNTNWLTLIDNVEKYDNNFKNSNKSFWFWEVGLRGLFGSKNIKQGLSLLIDLSFIIPQKNGRELIGTKDNIYPIFKFGVLKSLGGIYDR